LRRAAVWNGLPAERKSDRAEHRLGGPSEGSRAVRVCGDRRRANVPATTHAARRPATDEELMRRMQANDPLAFNELYDRHAGRAWSVARSVCHDASRAEDAVQEGFLSVWRSQGSYRGDRGSVQGWLMTVVRNRAIDATRREAAGHRPPLAHQDGVWDAPADGSTVDEVIDRCEADALRRRLAQLPGAQAQVIVLAYYAGLSNAEIATLLALPPGTVKGRMRLGLQKLRDQLAGVSSPVGAP
jgi:RNA polymerase sigma-70 factor, ECF subfamily